MSEAQLIAVVCSNIAPDLIKASPSAAIVDHCFERYNQVEEVEMMRKLT